MRQSGLRKRPAPGSSPLGDEKLRDLKNNTSYPMARPEYQQHASSDGVPPNYPDSPNNYGASNIYNGSMPANEPASPLGNQIVRRHPDNQIVPMMNYSNNEYPLAPDYGSIPPPAEDGWLAQYDDLDQKALLAKRDAQSKRKQIPPFIQKLSSFLDENTRNTDLIRWSESGDSFIVVDEDEFAKTLIPELFKHNNYASFVRQLNMYGFHKKVGLSDNSMRASERKNKNPSEYSNPYFKRSRPNLLWLIHKPKTAPAKGSGKGGAKAKQEDADDEDDNYFNRDSPGPQHYEGIDDGTGARNGRQPLMLGNTPKSLPPEQMVNLQRELAEIRQNQNKITEMLQIVRKEHHQLYGQAKAFHELHEQHDKSINSILTFLATVYTKNLPQGGLDFNNMFNTLPSKDRGHGNIVDVGDENHQTSTPTQNQPLHRKPPLLLKDGNADSPKRTGKSPRPYNKRSNDFYDYPTKSQSQSLHSPAIQELSDRSPSARSSQSPQINPEKSTDRQIPEADIMSMINSANAHNTNNYAGQRMEFPEALSHLQTADGQSPLTPSQRQNMLQLMSNENANSPQNAPNNLNALTSYSPTNSAANLAHFDMSKEQLDQISRSLQEQQERMANLNASIAPLSPSGSIPGVNDQSYQPNGQELDLDSIFNSGDYFNDGANPGDFDFSNSADIPDFDFSAPLPEGNEIGSVDKNEGRIVGSVPSSEATSPANTTDDGVTTEQLEGSPRKLRRRG